MSGWAAINTLREYLDTAEYATPEWQAADAALALVEQALEAAEQVTAKQQECLENLRSHGVVFKDIGNDPSNWQHVAFTIYTDFCDAEATVAAALRAVREGK